MGGAFSVHMCVCVCVCVCLCVWLSVCVCVFEMGASDTTQAFLCVGKQQTSFNGMTELLLR